MSTLSTIRDGLKTRLTTISGLRCYDVWPDAPNLPAAIVRPVRASLLDAFGGYGTVTFEVVVLVQMVNLPRAQDAIDAYLATTGTSSIKAALEGGAAVGGDAEDVTVTGWRDYGPMEVGDMTYFGVIFDVEVLAS